MKDANANMNRIKTDSISQISRTGSAVILDSMILMINKNGMANKKLIPNPDKPEKFFAFPPNFKYNKENYWRMCSCYLRINMLTK